MFNNWPRLAIIIAMIVGLGFVLRGLSERSTPSPQQRQSTAPKKATSVNLPDNVANSLREGDIIFRGKDFSWGDLGAQLSDRDKRYGHVGVIVRSDANWAVIDAIGNPLDAEGSVRLRTLGEFLTPATRLGLYRPALTEPDLDRFVAEVWRHEGINTPFDRLYDLQDQTALYCTELIWNALETATGQDQITEHTIFRDRRVIAIDDLQYAPLMTEIWTSDEAP